MSLQSIKTTARTLPRLSARQTVPVGLFASSSLGLRIRTPSRLPSPTSSSSLRAFQSLHAQRSYSSTTATGSREEQEEQEDPEEAKKPLGERLKALLKKYGRHALVVYLFLSTIDFSFSFAVVHLLGADQIGKVQDQVVNKYREYRYGMNQAHEMAIEAEVEKVKEEREEKEAFKELSREEQKAQASAPWYQNKLLWTEIALAYGIHKTALLPVRAGLTLAWTPKLVKWLTARGWIGKVSCQVVGSAVLAGA